MTAAALVGQRSVAVVGGAALAAVVLLARGAGVLSGPLALALTALSVLAVPTSRLLSRRILWHGAVLAGLVPVLWWVDLPLGSVGRGGLAMAGLVLGLTTWALWGGPGDVPRRLRLVVPRLGTGDLVVLTVAAAGLWFTRAWLRAQGGPAVLAALLPGWDHSAHLGMTLALRTHGATADAVPPPAGEAWHFATYPQGQHALVATAMEVLAPGVVDPAEQLLPYLRALSLMLVAVTVMLAAGLVSLPRLRRRPAVALPVVALAVAAFLVGPGAVSFAHGFTSFVLAAGLTACVPLVVTTMPRVTSPVQMLALGGLLVGIAHSWALLLLIALPAAAVVVLPERRLRWRASRRTWVASGVVVVVTAAGGLAAARLLLAHDARAVLILPGGVIGPDLGLLTAVVAGSVGLCLWGAGRRRGPRDGTTVGARTAWAATGPVVGLLAAFGIALLQLAEGGPPSYYFWKLLIGVELVAVVVLGVAVARWVRPADPARTRGERLRAGAASLLLAAGASQVFGAAVDGRDTFDVPGYTIEETVRMLEALQVARTVPGRTVVLTPEAEHAPDALSAQQWHMALQGTWTAQGNALASDALVDDAGGRETPARAAQAVLDEPGTWVIAPPEVVAEVREAVGPELADRVLTW